MTLVNGLGIILQTVLAQPAGAQNEQAQEEIVDEIIPNLPAGVSPYHPGEMKLALSQDKHQLTITRDMLLREFFNPTAPYRHLVRIDGKELTPQQVARMLAPKNLAQVRDIFLTANDNVFYLNLFEDGNSGEALYAPYGSLLYTWGEQVQEAKEAAGNKEAENPHSDKVGYVQAFSLLPIDWLDRQIGHIPPLKVPVTKIAELVLKMLQPSKSVPVVTPPEPEVRPPEPEVRPPEPTESEAASRTFTSPTHAPSLSVDARVGYCFASVTRTDDHKIQLFNNGKEIGRPISSGRRVGAGLITAVPYAQADDGALGELHQDLKSNAVTCRPKTEPPKDGATRVEPPKAEPLPAAKPKCPPGPGGAIMRGQGKCK